VPISQSLPAHQPNWTWTKLVHEDTERQCCGTEQEGTDGEAQIQHLLLVHTAEPFLYLIVRGVAQRHDHGLISLWEHVDKGGVL